MIGKTRKEYVFIRASIALLRLVAPASIVSLFAYLIGSLYMRKLLISPWFAIYPAAEASFYLLVYLPRRAFLQKVIFHGDCVRLVLTSMTNRQRTTPYL